MCHVIPVLSHEAVHVWPLLQAKIDKALAREGGFYLARDVLQDITHQDKQLWVVADDNRIMGCCITHIVQYPRKKMCRIFLVTGHRIKKWQHLIGAVEQWARSIGCDGLEAFARKGWQRILGDDFHVQTTYLTKEL